MFRALGDMLRALGFRSLGYESWKYLHLQSETVCVCVCAAGATWLERTQSPAQ